MGLHHSKVPGVVLGLFSLDDWAMPHSWIRLPIGMPLLEATLRRGARLVGTADSVPKYSQLLSCSQDAWAVFTACRRSLRVDLVIKLMS